MRCTGYENSTGIVRQCTKEQGHEGRHQHEPFSFSLSSSDSPSDYSTWTEDQLISEISNRHLAYGVSVTSFPDEQVRKRRLVEILEGNDKFRIFLKQIAKECVK